MTRWISQELLIELVGGDSELVLVLLEHGVIESRPEGFRAEDVDRALVSRTLIRELEVNWAGVDIILRMRQQLAEARRRLAAIDRKIE